MVQASILCWPKPICFIRGCCKSIRFEANFSALDCPRALNSTGGSMHEPLFNMLLPAQTDPALVKPIPKLLQLTEALRLTASPRHGQLCSPNDYPGACLGHRDTTNLPIPETHIEGGKQCGLSVRANAQALQPRPAPRVRLADDRGGDAT
jgi:hypothetical protein